MTFTFDLTDLRLIALFEHCRANFQHHRVCYGNGKVKVPSMMLVKDEGAYLMSPFTPPGAPESARLHEAGDPARLHVVYAEGCAPQDGYIGGDDFGEVLPIPEVRATDEIMIISVGERMITIKLK